jgi:hypothetical protein
VELVKFNKGKVWRNDVELKFCKKSQTFAENTAERGITKDVL